MQRFLSIKGYAGGGLVGYITCSYADLVKVFGEPPYTDGYKTSSEWCVEDTKTGEKFSIYDYKKTNLYSRDLPSVEEFRAQSSYDWHIGAMKCVDLEALQAFVTGQ